MSQQEDHDPQAARATSEQHVPVLLDRCVELLAPALSNEGAVLVDGTLGMGGHTEAVLRACPAARVVGIDRDEAAIALASKRLQPFGDRFTAVHTTYDHIDEVVRDVVGKPVQGVLLDLGVSSLQLDEDSRGFSYSRPAPLDMRMDTSCGQTAADLLADASESELTRILRVYGEERFAPRIAAAIVRERENEPVLTSNQLAHLVLTALPYSARSGAGHPAKRTFQALRIAVNQELDILAEAMPRAIEALAVGGRIVVESYHSLEDRIVKRALARGAESSAPRDWPVEPPTHRPYLELLVRGAVKADEAETSHNPRSASVRLRAAVRVRTTPEHMLNHDQPTRPERGGAPSARVPARRTPGRRAPGRTTSARTHNRRTA